MGFYATELDEEKSLEVPSSPWASPRRCLTENLDNHFDEQLEGTRPGDINKFVAHEQVLLRDWQRGFADLFTTFCASELGEEL